MAIDTTELNNLIIGRVDPKIYAFSTSDVPDHLKVGDTFRPLHVRLEEWKKHYPCLIKEYEALAKINDTIFFRDHAVHQYLISNGKTRLPKDPHNRIHSNEFFKHTNSQDLDCAVSAIKESHRQNLDNYQYYTFDERRVQRDFEYERNKSYKLRPNQNNTVNKFKKAIKQGRKNLLMYAVMRFGKSFTSMMCAVKMEAKLVVIVSAKADVKNEWKKTVQEHTKFDKYEFLDSKKLNENHNIISNFLK
ncbi:MAG: restriction endonuclease, partial [Candidatus Kapaibacteriota bacterium]